MTRRADLDSMLESHAELRRRLARADDVADRVRVISQAPLFSLWSEVKAALEEASEEIERLKARIRSLEGEDA